MFLESFQTGEAALVADRIGEARFQSMKRKKCDEIWMKQGFCFWGEGRKKKKKGGGGGREEGRERNGDERISVPSAISLVPPPAHPTRPASQCRYKSRP